MFEKYSGNDFWNNYQTHLLSLGVIETMNDTNNMINRTHGLVDTNFPLFNVNQFLIGKNLIQTVKEYETKYNDIDVFISKFLIRKMFTELNTEGFYIRGNFFAYREGETPALLSIRPRLLNKTVLLSIEYYALYDNIESVISYVEKTFKLDRRETTLAANYAYINGDRLSYFSDISVRPLANFYPECYPYIDNVDKFIDDYMESTSNVLILTGEPGTGKSTFINYLLQRTKSSCYVAYDEAVMKMDSFYIDFMSDDFSVMILEDADIILRSRIKDNNKIMSKILNISDGILSLKNKKFIFTANLNDVEDIDSAISRPGRCYDIINFRSLDKNEAMAAATAMGTEINMDKHEYTVAEIFNKKRISDILGTISPKQKVGF